MRRSKISECVLLDLLSKGFNQLEIAKKLQCSPAAVSVQIGKLVVNGKWKLKPRNEDRTKKLEEMRIKRAIDMAAKGYSVSDIVHLLQVNSTQTAKVRELVANYVDEDQRKLIATVGQRCPECGRKITTPTCMPCAVARHVEVKKVVRPYVAKVNDGYASVSVG